MPTTLPKPAAPAPATPKPAAPTPAAASTASGFAVQLAAPAEEAAALGLRDRARAAGFTAFVQRVDTAAGARFRVRLGPTADRAAADALRDAASSKLGISGNVVSHP
jgi:cell division septation protein DedD